MTNKQDIEKWRATRKKAGLHIDPETAEVEWSYANVIDPYGLEPELPEQCWGREYFARSPGSNVWVCFGDLPDSTRNVFWEKHGRKLAFPAGLEEALGARDWLSAPNFKAGCAEPAH
jgi:hypothetical protein